MFTKFISFLYESRFQDIFKSNDDYFNKFINTKFVDDDKLIQYINLEKFGNKIIGIEYNNYDGHLIKDKIKNRTNFKSISEFNTFLEEILNKLFNNFEEIDEKVHKYNIYSINYNISLIFYINYENLFDINTRLKLLTIINGYNSNVQKIIKL